MLYPASKTGELSENVEKRLLPYRPNPTLLNCVASLSPLLSRSRSLLQSLPYMQLALAVTTVPRQDECIMRNGA
eukprot:4797257-Pleurochrysis_carterae.AAC.1